MSGPTAARRALVRAAVSAVSGLMIVSTALPAAQAAARQAPALHATSTVALGSTGNIFKNIFTEAPDGTVFYSRGSVVYVQKGSSAPRVALHARKQVLALAANSQRFSCRPA